MQQKKLDELKDLKYRLHHRTMMIMIIDDRWIAPTTYTPTLTYNGIRKAQFYDLKSMIIK